MLGHNGRLIYPGHPNFPQCLHIFTHNESDNNNMKSMKKFLFAICAVLALSACTENQRARQFGGTATIQVPKGQKVMMATWKGDDLFYMTEPMDSAYVPTTKTFSESSSWGILESTVKFIESR